MDNSIAEQQPDFLKCLLSSHLQRAINIISTLFDTKYPLKKTFDDSLG